MGGCISVEEDTGTIRKAAQYKHAPMVYIYDEKYESIPYKDVLSKLFRYWCQDIPE